MGATCSEEDGFVQHREVAFSKQQRAHSPAGIESNNGERMHRPSSWASNPYATVRHELKATWRGGEDPRKAASYYSLRNLIVK